MNKQNDQKMVSIYCIAYNQEIYIETALEGFIKQKTDFKFEVIIHDDASTDNTSIIIKKYAAKYPDIIKPILQTNNIYSKEAFNGIDKVMRMHLTGKYIAFCEGDDYWIDENKLQKQVDFLEYNSEYTMCWSNCIYEYCAEGGRKEAVNRYSSDCESPLKDVIEKGGGFIPTPTIMMRSEVYLNMPEGAKGHYMYDFPMQMWSTYVGKSYYMKDPMSVYRLMAIGSWTSGVQKETYEETIQHLKDEECLCNTFDKLFKYEYTASFERRIAHYLFWLCYWADMYKEATPYLKLRDKHNMKTDIVIRLKVKGFVRLGNLLGKLRSVKDKIINCAK